MKLAGNTVLITGGGSGIGLAMAEEFLRLGNQVIVGGRSQDKLRAAAEKGLKTLTVDMTKSESIGQFAHQVIQEFPSVNVVIHNAGVMKNENLLNPNRVQVAEETVAANFLGPMVLTDLLLPHFLKQPAATIVTVTSGLAFLPLALTPTYSATKAAIHSYTQSLRYQLKATNVQVIELAPPYVQTHLMGSRQAQDPNAMPLAEFIAEVFAILDAQPQVQEVMVKRVQPQRQSSDGGQEKYDAFFTKFNDQMLAARQAEFFK